MSFQEKDENAKDSTAEKDAAGGAATPAAAEEVKENGVAEPEGAAPAKSAVEGDATAAGDQLNESALSQGEKTPEGATDGKTEETEAKKKEGKNKKKKWSFRSISFSKKDKSKPTTASKEAEKNGEVKEVAEEVSYFFLLQISFFHKCCTSKTHYPYL
nr:unnamed protein product [Callosobruchus chinensis]